MSETIYVVRVGHPDDPGEEAFRTLERDGTIVHVDVVPVELDR